MWGSPRIEEHLLFLVIFLFFTHCPSLFTTLFLFHFVPLSLTTFHQKNMVLQSLPGEKLP